MNKIYCIMGKSSSGKDTLYKELTAQIPGLKTVTPYTTRPIREGESNGVEYHFVTEEELFRYGAEGKLIELRTYHTVCGDWHYATVDDGQIDFSGADYIVIGTLASYEKMKEYYGEGKVVPLYIEVDDADRLIRAVERERRQDAPQV